MKVFRNAISEILDYPQTKFKDDISVNRTNNVHICGNFKTRIGKLPMGLHLIRN